MTYNLAYWKAKVISLMGKGVQEFSPLDLPSKDKQNRACSWTLTRVGLKVDQAMLGPFPCPWSLFLTPLDYLRALEEFPWMALHHIEERVARART